MQPRCPAQVHLPKSCVQLQPGTYLQVVWLKVLHKARFPCKSWAQRCSRASCRWSRRGTVARNWVALADVAAHVRPRFARGRAVGRGRAAVGLGALTEVATTIRGRPRYALVDRIQWLDSWRVIHDGTHARSPGLASRSSASTALTQ